ncbi:MAG: VIT1/CCC1 transporter family protein [Spirochaetes bacterium]|nr:VIT1/CCC1 transporter family protein [Spirochaetota bacterium]
MKLPRFSTPADRLQQWHGENWHTAKGRLVRDVLYSVDSGLVTTVSFLAGISLSLARRDALLGAVTIQVVAGALAIFFSSYSSTRAQKLFYENQIERERREIAANPRKETAEIRVVFRELGFTRGEQDLAARRIAADTSRWLRFMVQEEIGISPSSIDNPWEIGFVSAGAFLLGALPAVLPFLVLPSVAAALWVSAALVLAFLFGIGIVSTRVTKANWLAGGLETLLFGALACGAGFLLGRVALRYLS